MEIEQAAPKAAVHCDFGHIIPTHYYTQLDAAHRQRSACQREIINCHLTHLRLELAQKRDKVATGERRFKGKVLFDCRQRFQAHQHNATRLHRHRVGMAPRQAAGDVVGIHEGVDTQRGDDGICVCGLACAVGAGKDDDAGNAF